MSTRLNALVEDYLTRGGSLENSITLLRRCVEDRSLEALSCVRRLYEDMYGRITFNYELKAPAASTLVIWGDIGLRALVEGTIAHPEIKNYGISLILLSALAADGDMPTFGRVPDTLIATAIDDARSHGKLVQSARRHLIDLILSIEDDEDVASYVGFALQTLGFANSEGARELFAALSKRWLAVGSSTLNEFENLITDRPQDEPAFQAFLSAHPQILDPLAVRLWPQPSIHGFKEPDFVVQRADGSYMVVEIECPAKGLVTSGNHLRSEVTHAESQASDYRTYLMKNFSAVEKYFPDFQEPDCLVVVGLESSLTSMQRQALRDANSNRRHMRIAGFDWLLDRARTMAHNITQPSVEIIKARIV